MPYLMQRLIIIAHATGVQPIGAWWRGTSRGLVASYDDTLAAAITGRQAGFKGGLCMQAHQVTALNTGFTPTDEETAAAVAQANGDASHAAIAANLVALSTACKEREQARAAVVAQTQATATSGA